MCKETEESKRDRGRRQKERIGCKRRRPPEARIHLVKLRPLSWSWILSTWFFHSLTPFPSGAWFSQKESFGWRREMGRLPMRWGLAPHPIETWGNHLEKGSFPSLGWVRHASQTETADESRKKSLTAKSNRAQQWCNRVFCVNQARGNRSHGSDVSHSTRSRCKLWPLSHSKCSQMFQMLELSFTYSPPYGSIHLQSSPSIRSYRTVILITSTSLGALAAFDYNPQICADFPLVSCFLDNCGICN